MPALVVLDRLPVAALAVAGDGAIVFANRACAEMLGYTQDELTSLQFRELFCCISRRDRPPLLPCVRSPMSSSN